MIDTWTPHPMYCPNCGQLNVGYRNNEGKIKYQCKRCTLVFVRTEKNRRHDVIDIYVPKESVNLNI